jgi:hydrogenase maturation protease
MELQTSNFELQTSIVVLGLGNPLMADEGVGVAVIERLRQQAEQYTDVEFIDAGTGGMAVLHWIEGRRKAVFVDCAFMDEPPGAVRRFTPDQVRSTKTLARESLHEADLLRILDLAVQLGQAPQQVVIFGIQPQVVTARLGLSKMIADRMEHYVEVIRSELEKKEESQV